MSFRLKIEILRIKVSLNPLMPIILRSNNIPAERLKNKIVCTMSNRTWLKEIFYEIICQFSFFEQN